MQKGGLGSKMGLWDLLVCPTPPHHPPPSACAWFCQGRAAVSAMAPGPRVCGSAQAGDAEDISASSLPPQCYCLGLEGKGLPQYLGGKGGLDQAVLTSIQVPGGDTCSG